MTCVREIDYVKNHRVKWVKQRKQWEPTDILKITHLISAILVINPNAKFHALFSAPHNVDAMVHDLSLIVDL